ncbi:hypothetical protein HanPSC8_Chr16g0742411 [Helianthus annuus]|nr:hypothetical protein HanPSC8_Chr16g0742411 [Helianthus annuus]
MMFLPAAVSYYYPPEDGTHLELELQQAKLRSWFDIEQRIEVATAGLHSIYAVFAVTDQRTRIRNYHCRQK